MMHRPKMYHNHRAGFTLLEMMIGISISLIILSIAIFGWQGARQSANFDVSIGHLLNDISRARVDSLAGRTYDVAPPLGGYGVSFRCNTGLAVVDYCRFMDTSADGIVDPAEIIVSGNFDDLPFMSAPIEYAGIELILSDAPSVAITAATIAFRSPQVSLVTTPESSTLAVQELRIMLRHQTSGKIQIVAMDSTSGLLYVE